MKQKEFDNIFDECFERILDGETLEQCLKRYPEQAAELKPLLETVLAVKEASAVEPRPEFKARARYQFRSALQEKAAPQRRPFFGWLPRWATALVIVLIVLLAGGGTVAAASNSMPDSILYPVKLATENVQLALTTSDLDKARLCANFADRRVAEIIYMAERGDARRVEEITERLDDRLETLVVLVAELEVDVAGEAEAMLSLPDGDADGATIGPTAVVEDGGWGRGRHGHPRNRAGLKVLVAGSAANNPAVLRAMLKDMPQSVREALIEAIEVSEEGYARVLATLE